MRLAACAAFAPWLVLLGVAMGCPTPTQGPLPPLVIGEGCQPLLAEVVAEGAECRLPFPSDFFRQPDATLPSGFSVQFTGDARPATVDDFSADITRWRPADGFARLPAIVGRLAGPVTTTGAVTLRSDVELSVEASSPTVIVEAQTGRLIRHFMDIDGLLQSDDDVSRQTFILRPQELLRPETRYLVAVRRLVDDTGTLAATPEGFRRVRDGVWSTADAVDLTSWANHIDQDVLALLADAGIERADLQLAWDFTTGSTGWVQQDMLAVREQTLTSLAAISPVVEITAVLDDNTNSVWRRVRGNITVPLFLENDQAGASLFRDDNGEVTQNGFAVVDFYGVVPLSVRDGSPEDTTAKAPLLYGHGFFGDKSELESGRTRALLGSLGRVGFALDWWGMSGVDLGTVVSSFGSESSRSMQFSERVPQAMANAIALSFALEQGLVDHEGLRRPADGSFGPAGDPLFTAARPSFLGISMGHILGGTLLALNPYVERGILHVGGSGLSQMMPRSAAFAPLMGVIDLAISDPLDKQFIMALLQIHLERIDPATWAPYLAGDALPGEATPTSRPELLMQIALADSAVPNFAGVFHAQQLGLAHVGQSPRQLGGLPTVGELEHGGGLTIFDVALDPSFEATASAPVDNEAHEHLRDVEQARAQMREFLATGRIAPPCPATCTFPVPSAQ